MGVEMNTDSCEFHREKNGNVPVVVVVTVGLRGG